MTNFVHLNVKSEYSLLNSIAKTTELIEATRLHDVKTIALTDLNNMFNVYHFEQKCKEANVKNIIGVTFSIKYKDNQFGNITLLAKDILGYKNLVKLSTIANIGECHTGKNGFAYLELCNLEEYAKGLICLTGGTSGILFKYHLDKNYVEIEELVNTYIHIYGRDNVYIEMQNHNIPGENEFIRDKNIYALLQKNKIETVATNDVYYTKREHSYHRALAIEMNPNKNGIEFYSNYVNYNDEWYLKTPDEMTNAFKEYLSIYPNILANTVKIADLCNVSVPVEKALPEFPIPKGYNEDSYLRYLAYEGFKERFDGRKDIDIEAYKKRLEYELDVIKEMGFTAYHIITADFIQWAKDDKVYMHPERYFPKEYYQDYSTINKKLYEKDYEILVGPGRGSAAGSLLCYCLKITNLDPIKDGLLFERFLNVERVSMPDIDIDFPNAHRYDVVEYVQDKYGYEKVSQIATFQTLGVKSIIKSVGKALNLPFDLTNEMTKNVPEKELVEEEDENGNIEIVEKKIELLSQLEKYEYFITKINSNEDIMDLFKIGKILEGLPSSTGKHAAGVIIGRKDLINYMPLMEVDGVMVAQFEKKASESIGMLKMDFLGLQTLDVLAEAQKLIEQFHHEKIILDDIPLNDSDTFNTIFQTGKTGKVFQFESPGMQKLLIRMKPTCIADLCAANAAYRPGPMQFIDEFIQGRNSPSNVKYPTKEYEIIAKETMGILFYQEQIMQIVQAMAGFTLGEADILRRGIAKKEKKYIDETRKSFVDGCLKLNTTDKLTAEKIYSTIEKFANYGFNKSHSDAYALIAYWCGYLKAHFPECFMAANLTICSNDIKKLAYTLSEINKMNLELLPPDIRYSKERFTLENKDNILSIRYSLGAIKSIREENARIFANIKDTTSLYNFLLNIPHSSLRKNQITNLIYSGAFDFLGSRKDLSENLGKIMEMVKVVHSFKEKNIPTILSYISPKTTNDGYEFQQLDKLKKEKDCIQIALSGHPVSAVRNIVTVTNTLADFQTDIIDGFTEDFNNMTVEIAGLITNSNPIITKKGETMCFCTIEDEFFTTDGVIFPRDYEKLKGILEETLETPVLIKAKLQKKMTDSGEYKICLIINSIEKIIKYTYTIYIDDSNLHSDLINEISRFNGIASVMLVDNKLTKIKRLPFCVDVNKSLIQLLKTYNIRYLIKK